LDYGTYVHSMMFTVVTSRDITVPTQPIKSAPMHGNRSDASIELITLKHYVIDATDTLYRWRQ